MAKTHSKTYRQNERSQTVIKLMMALLSCAITVNAFAWGRQGHSLIGETASRVVAASEDFELLLSRAYDVGYYSNVPDMIWKRTDTIHKLERHNHYMDIDVFISEIPISTENERQINDRAKHQKSEYKIKSKSNMEETLEPFIREFQLDRLAFNKKYPQIELSAGRSFWRIREIEAQLTQVTSDLKLLDKGQDPKAMPPDLIARKHELQKKWLQLIGYISHYVGDLGQPLHVTSNHDGQSTNQQGIHGFYEDAVVDVLTPELRVEVLELAQKRWPAYHKKHAHMTTLEVLIKLTQNSLKEIDRLLEIDRKHGREDILKVRAKYKKQITERMVDASLALAEIISRQLGWQANTHRFYTFEPEPDYLDYPR